jgi:Domain of unknown function (DUF4384)/Caspase domain
MCRPIVALVASLVPMLALAVDTIVTRPTDLRADRYVDAPSLRPIASGTHVELLKTEAGWVQIRIDAQTGWVRATGLGGEAASVSALARLETGRSASGNIVVAAGIRRIPKASKHALIIGVDTVTFDATSSARWPGIGDDIESARLIADRIGVPSDNVEVVRGAQTTAALIGQALDRLNERVQPGDQVLVYFSGPGAQTLDEGRCASAWVGLDGATMSATALARRLQPALSTADKVLVISDAGYAATVSAASTRKSIALPVKRACGAADANVQFGLVDAAVALGISSQNLVHLQSSPGIDQGVQQANAGGLMTQALVDCFLGDAADLDQSASISIGELTTCANRHGRTTARTRPSIFVTVSGNAAYSPIIGVMPAPASSSTAASSPPVGNGSPRAAIDDVYAQRDGRIDVTLTATPNSLQIGRDFIDLKLTSTRAGFVYLVLLGSDGKSFYLLFPNDLDRDNRIATGETVRLPRPSWRVQPQGPPGHDTILAIVAESERDLTSFAGHKEGPFSTALTDPEGRAQLQWLLGRSSQADAEQCVEAGKRRNLSAIKVCSDAFGAALVDVIETAKP